MKDWRNYFDTEFEARRKKYEEHFLLPVTEEEKRDADTIDAKMLEALAQVYKSSDLQAAEYVRSQLEEDSFVLYRDSHLGMLGPFTREDEPEYFPFCLEPNAYKAAVSNIKENIGKNNGVCLRGCDYGMDGTIYMHFASGLLWKSSKKERVLFPKVEECEERAQKFDVGDVVEYTTAVDHKKHYGKVISIDENSVTLKEYTGFLFEADGYRLFEQDVHNSVVSQHVTVPINACARLDDADARIDSIRLAEILRRIWIGPDQMACETLRQWIGNEEEKIPVYVLKHREEESPEIMRLYTFKEHAEQWIVETQEMYEAEQLWDCIEDWVVEETSIGKILTEYPNPDHEYHFTVNRLFTSFGFFTLETYINYYAESGLVERRYYELMEEENHKYYPAKNLENTECPLVGAIVEYTDKEHGIMHAKVEGVEQDMVRVNIWNGIFYQSAGFERRTPEVHTITTYLYVPMNACLIIPTFRLSEEQLKAIIRFEKDNALCKEPWRLFEIETEDRLEFDVDDMVRGLEIIEDTHPEIIGRWLNFISAAFLHDIDSNVLEIVNCNKRLYEEAIRKEMNADGDFKLQTALGEDDYIRMIEDIIISIDEIYFP